MRHTMLFRDVPMVNTKPVKKRTSPNANNVESKKKRIPRTRNPIPYLVEDTYNTFEAPCE
jgi:hypothetical protein